jgi:hypothetical protein
LIGEVRAEVILLQEYAQIVACHFPVAILVDHPEDGENAVVVLREELVLFLLDPFECLDFPKRLKRRLLTSRALS